MFDSPLCPREFTKFPLVVSWRQILSFNLPTIVLVLIVISVVLAFYAKRSPSRRLLTRWLFVKRLAQLRRLFIGLTALFILMFTVVANGLFLPTDAGDVVDAIVVLGRGRDLRIERVDIAAQLWQAKRAPMIFVSGRGDATAMVQRLEEILPPPVVDGENCSLTTQENAIFSAAILRTQRKTKILLVTDPPHMWRSLFDFRTQGFRVIPHPSLLPDTWSWRRQAFLTFRECVALISHSLRSFFIAQQPKTSSPQLWRLIEQAQQYGQARSSSSETILSDRFQ